MRIVRYQGQKDPKDARIPIPGVKCKYGEHRMSCLDLSFVMSGISYGIGGKKIRQKIFILLSYKLEFILYINLHYI